MVSSRAANDCAETGYHGDPPTEPSVEGIPSQIFVGDWGQAPQPRSGRTIALRRDIMGILRQSHPSKAYRARSLLATGVKPRSRAAGRLWAAGLRPVANKETITEAIVDRCQTARKGQGGSAKLVAVRKRSCVRPLRAATWPRAQIGSANDILTDGRYLYTTGQPGLSRSSVRPIYYLLLRPGTFETGARVRR